MAADFQLSDAERQVDEGTTKQFEMVLNAEDGSGPIPASAITSITIALWYLDRSGTKRTINSRNGQSINGTNNGTFGATNGTLDLYFQTADTTMQNPDLSVPKEDHSFRIDWSYNSSNGVRSGQYRDFFTVRRKSTQI